MVRLHLFGCPAAEVGGESVVGPASQRHRIALLALLANAPDRTVSRNKLIGWLWPDADATSARHLLSVAVHVLRDGLGKSALRSDRDELAISADVRIDVADFHAAFARGALAEAVAQYRGPFLDGFFLDGAAEFDQWAERERAHLAALYRDALQSLAQAADAADDSAAALGWWRALAHEDPFNTGGVAGLMLALERAGDRGNAIQLAREHEELLRRELEAEPDEDFKALVRRLQVEPAGFGGLGSRPDPRPMGDSAGSGWTDGSVTPPTIASGGGRSSKRRGGALLALGATVTLGAALVAIATAADRADTNLVQRRAVVSHFENRTGDPGLDPVGFMVADWITKGALGLGLAEVVSSDEVLRSPIVRGPESGSGVPLEHQRALGREMRARLAIGGSYYLQGDSIVFQAQVIDVRDGRVLRAIDEVRAPARVAAQAVGVVRDRVVGGLATLLDERMAAWSDRASQPTSLDAYRQYAAGMDAFLGTAVAGPAERLRQLSVAAQHFRAAAAADSTFTAPLIWAVYSHWNGGAGDADDLLERLDRTRDRMAPWDQAMADHVLAHSRGDYSGALAAARRAVQYAPDSEWQYKVAYMALRTGRPREGIAALAQVDPVRGWMASWPAYWSELAAMHHMLGEYATALEVAGRCLRQHPGNPSCRFAEVAALIGSGRVARAREFVNDESSESYLSSARLVRELQLHRHDEAADEVAKLAADRALARGDVRSLIGSVNKDIGSANKGLVLIGLLLDASRLDDAQAIAEVLVSDSAAVGIRSYYRFVAAARLGAIAARRGQVDQIVRVDRLLNELEQHLDPDHRRHASLRRAEFLAELGQVDSAFALVRQAVAGSEPIFNEVQHHRGRQLAVLLRDYPPFQRLTRPKE